MKLRQLGNSSLQVSEVGLGGNTFGPPRADEAASIRAIKAALDLGVNFIDTAIVYGEGQSEVFIGKALKDGRREHTVIATKFMMEPPPEGARAPSGGAIYMPDALKLGTLRERVIGQCEESLRKLDTDYIDLYQLHGYRGNATRATVEEMLGALDELVQAGKVREVGSVGAPAWRVAEAIAAGQSLGVKSYVSAQNYYNLLRRQIEAELVPCCRSYGLSIIPFAPLAGGFLTGKYREGQPPPPGTRGAEGSPLVRRSASERNWQILPQLEAFATARGHTLAELAIAWLLANPLVASVITGVSNQEQAEANVKGADWVLTPEEKAEIDALAPREGDDGAGVG
jgi:aryl-alcohol dehydrogenase-like predicted oxidoreductase